MKIPNVKLHENPSCGCNAVPRGLVQRIARIFVQFWTKSEFTGMFQWKSQVWNFMKILLVGVILYHVDRRIDTRTCWLTGLTQLNSSFRQLQLESVKTPEYFPKVFNIALLSDIQTVCWPSDRSRLLLISVLISPSYAGNLSVG